MHLIYDNKLYHVDIIAEKGNYTTTLQEKNEIIGTGSTIEEAVTSLFTLLDVQKDFNEHHGEAPKVSKHKESKEFCVHQDTCQSYKYDPSYKCNECPFREQND